MSLLQTGDARPQPRHGHVAWMYQEHMFIFGGYAQDPFGGLANNKVLLKDVWAFNTRTHTWAQVCCTGIIPSPRADMGEPPCASSLGSDPTHLQ